MEEEKTNDDEIKVILVGDSGVGKTCLINITIGIPFNENEKSSSASSFSKKKININKKQYIINLWDTMGQERLRYLTQLFFNNAKIVIFVYDITNKQSFKELDFWFKTIQDVLGNEPVIGIAGNKKDLVMKEEVPEEEAQKFADEKKVPLKLTSAKNPLSFNSFLEDLIKKYIEKNGGKIESGEGQKLENKDNKKPGNKKCC